MRARLHTWQFHSTPIPHCGPRQAKVASSFFGFERPLITRASRSTVSPVGRLRLPVVSRLAYSLRFFSRLMWPCDHFSWSRGMRSSSTRR